jgi:hypothetical protein
MISDEMRIQLAKEAFSELKDAAGALQTKVGQLLIAATFFLTATIALLTISQVRNFSYLLPNGASVASPRYLLGAFIVLTSLAVMHLTMALGLSLKPRRHLDNSDISYIEWWSMVQRGKEEWTNLFKEPQEIRVYQLRHLLEAVRYQVRMTNYTYERLVEARAYFFIAVTAFISAMPGVLDALSSSKTTDIWGWHNAIYNAIAIVGVLFIAGNDRFRLEADIDTIPDKRSPARSFQILAAGTAMSSGTAVLAVGGSVVAIVAYAAILLATAAWLVNDRRCEHHRDRTLYDRLPPWWPMLILAVGVMLYVFPLSRTWLLLYAFWPILIFEGIRLLDNKLFRSRVAAGEHEYASGA